MTAPEPGPGVYRLRVHWEDTDAGGIVYYANYLRFTERARSEALLALGLSQLALRDELGLLFAVREARIAYLAPARLEDQLVVTTTVTRIGGARIEMAQRVLRDDTLIADCTVSLVCLDPQGRPMRLPAVVRSALATLGPVPATP